jgi:hypothetical protein
VWSESLFLLGLDLLNRMHPFLLVPESTCRVVADRSLCKACILVCAAVSQRDAVAVLGSVLYDVK